MYSPEHYQRYKETYKRNSLKWARNNKEKRKSIRKVWLANNPRTRFKHIIKMKYNMKLEEYDKLLQEQVGCCAICNSQFENSNRGGPQVDHNHETGRVRGLLCFQCNSGLGHFADNKNRIKAALQYLERNDKL